MAPNNRNNHKQSWQASMAPILITSFRPWKAHQEMNSSDRLLEHVIAKLPENVIALRGLPVNFDLAPMAVINHIVHYRPKVVLCCGMAETRKTLTIERWGIGQDQPLTTPIDLPTLVQKTIHTHISDDAGRFVCNHLYYQVLQFLKQSVKPSLTQQTAALFIHVPLITPANQRVLEFDFLKIVEHLNTVW